MTGVDLRGVSLVVPPIRRLSAQRPPELKDLPREERRALDAAIDEFVADSFPASDPPAWSCLSERIAGSRRRA